MSEPKSFTVRDIPGELFDAVKAKAKAERRSINQQIIVCLEQCRPPVPTAYPLGSLTGDTVNEKTEPPTG